MAGRGRARPSGRLEVKTLERRDQEDEEGDAPVGVREAPPYVEWETSTRSWKSEAPQHCHTLQLRSPAGEPRSSELPERAAPPSEGTHRGGSLGLHRADLFW